MHERSQRSWHEHLAPARIDGKAVAVARGGDALSDNVVRNLEAQRLPERDHSLCAAGAAAVGALHSSNAR